MPVVPINYFAILVCGVASVVLGFIWFGPLFGKTWMRLAGMPDDAMERAKADPAMKRKMYTGYFIAFVAALIGAVVLDHNLVFGSAYLHMSGLSAGFQAGFWNWLGFTVPPTLGMVLWEGKSWKLWTIINAYWLLLFLIMGAILALWM